MHDAAITAPQAQATTGKSLIGAVLVALYLVGIYTHVTVFVAPSVPWPAAAAGAAGALLLLKNISAVRPKHVTPMFFLLCVGFASTLFAPEFSSLLAERIKSLLLLTYSITTCYGFYLEIVQWRRDQVARLFLIASVLVIVGCALEAFTTFGDISDSFRLAVFPEEYLYIENVRDRVLFGMVRPKLFTAEPSFVAIFLVLVITVWLVLSTSPSRFFWYFVMLGLGLFLIRSPVMLLGAVTGGAAGFSFAARASPTERGKRVNKIILISLALMVSAAFLYVALITIMSERLDVILAGHDDSFTVRITAPFQIAWETIARYPFFGAGIGGREAILDIVLQTYLPVIAGIDHMYDRLAVGITSVFWLHWIFFGLIGGVAALMAIVKLMRSLGAGSLFFPAIVVLGFSHTMGAYVGPRFWTVFFVVLAATHLARMTQAEPAAEPAMGLAPEDAPQPFGALGTNA